MARDGTTGLDLATRETFDLILLDLMLPGHNGLAICQKLRQSGSSTPILMLTARRQTTDKVVGLRMGADDYMTKPFQTMELLARIEALLRRARQPAETIAPRYQFGDVQIDVRGTEVSRDGKQLSLSAKEFQLLRYPVEHPGTTISREELLRDVWCYRGCPSTRTVDVHIGWLRQKLEKDPRNPEWIHTVIGMGYKFDG